MSVATMIPSQKPEVNQLFFDAIELGHLPINVISRLALTAPSNE